jgi:hypothetical protein
VEEREEGEAISPSARSEKEKSGSNVFFAFSVVERAKRQSGLSFTLGGYEDLARSRRGALVPLRARANSSPLGCSTGSPQSSLYPRTKRELERKLSSTDPKRSMSSDAALSTPPAPEDFASFFERRAAVSFLDESCCAHGVSFANARTEGASSLQNQIWSRKFARRR